VKRDWEVCILSGIVAVALMVPSGAFAQTQPGGSGPADPTRVDELVKYARAKYEQGQAQPVPAQQRTLEERAEARPVIQLTVDQASRWRSKRNIELSVERLNPQLQDLSLAPDPRHLPADAELDGERQLVHAPADQFAERRQPRDEPRRRTRTSTIAHTLPWFGTNYTAAFNNGRTNTTSTFATLNPQFTTQLTATVTQPLLRDFRSTTTRNQLLTGNDHRAR